MKENILKCENRYIVEDAYDPLPGLMRNYLLFASEIPLSLIEWRLDANKKNSPVWNDLFPDFIHIKTIDTLPVVFEFYCIADDFTAMYSLKSDNKITPQLTVTLTFLRDDRVEIE